MSLFFWKGAFRFEIEKNSEYYGIETKRRVYCTTGKMIREMNASHLSRTMTALILMLAVSAVCLLLFSGRVRTKFIGLISEAISSKTSFMPNARGLKDASGRIISEAVNLSGIHDLTISGRAIAGGAVPAITLNNCYNIRITGNKLFNSTDVGIHLFRCTNITIDHNYFTNVSTGVYVQQTSGGGIVVTHNQFLNMKGPMPRGQFVQFDHLNGPGCSISHNRGENIPGKSNPEDAINLYMSNGTAISPITVAGNWIRGGGPSKTGGGIVLGDAGGSYQVAENNVLINPGQYGIGIAAGTNLRILNNKIYAAKNSFTNVGITIWNQYTNTSSCALIVVRGNQVNWTNSNGVSNPAWNNGNCGTIEGWGENSWNARINPAILPAVMITSK